MEKIILNNGKISIPIGQNVVGLDIKLSGQYELEYITKSNFYIDYSDNRIIGFGVGTKLGISTFLEYTGNLKIINCKVVKDNLKVVELLPYYQIDKFNKNHSTFDGSQGLIENLSKDNVFGTIPQKIKTTFKNEIYDQDGKKIDIQKNNNRNISRILKTINMIKTEATSTGGY
tara:strand:+ start:2049 stop:2567 length:519 start_codon:yes stop_codon:yes gene_type:complete